MRRRLKPFRRLGGALPYTVIIASLMVCVPTLVADRSLDATSTRVATVMICVVLVRQYIMLRENAALARRLEQGVDERTAEVAAREHFRVLAHNSSDVVMAVTDEMVVTYASHSADHLLGRPLSDLVGTAITDLDTTDMAAVTAAMDQARRTGGRPVPVQWSITSRLGNRTYIESLIAHLPDEPSVRGFVFNSRDITDRRLLEHELTYQAFHDALTGLPNRALFKDRLQQALNRFDRHGERFAILFCDLDSFKAVNDSVGHGLGDVLLTQVAQRLQASVRAGDTVARLGGDEFALLLENVEDEDITAASERVVQTIEKPFRLGDDDVFIGTSVGVVVSDGQDNHDLDALLRNADLAMYVAKALGKSRYVRFETSMHDRFLQDLQMKNDLRSAVSSDEMVLHYQPIFDLHTGHIASVEALVRWNHPSRGLLPPNDFIPICEETGIIVDLGQWVLERSCRQLAEWSVAHPRKAPESISVNISGRQLLDDDIVLTVRSALISAGLAPQRLTLEVTESVLLQDVVGVVTKLHALQDLGVRLAIDDFGTGYSSLNYLRHFPIDILKIDRAFVTGIGYADDDSLLATAITTLGRMLELKTVAEGIEHAEELDELKRMGCDMGQGYLFARAVTAADFDALLAEAPPRQLRV